MSQFKKGNIPWNAGKSGKEITNHYKKGFGFLSNRKGKTYEEIYGKEKAKKIKERQSNVAKQNIRNGVENAFSKGKKHSKYWAGKKHTEATKEKIRRNRYNPMLYPENKKKISEKLKGRIPKNLLELNRNKFGVNNPMWNGGSSLRGYDKKWNRKFRHFIRKRDNFICMVCNKHQEKERKRLSVHHIDYNKEMSFPENCITLCNSCHNKTNINRKEWKIFFKSLLSKKYGYTPIEVCEKDINKCLEITE